MGFEVRCYLHIFYPIFSFPLFLWFCYLTYIKRCWAVGLECIVHYLDQAFSVEDLLRFVESGGSGTKSRGLQYLAISLQKTWTQIGLAMYLVMASIVNTTFYFHSSILS